LDTRDKYFFLDPTLWKSVHELNPNSTFFTFELEKAERLIHRREIVLGKKSTNEWKLRIQSKSPEQKILDRELLETVGYSGKTGGDISFQGHNLTSNYTGRRRTFLHNIRSVSPSPDQARLVELLLKGATLDHHLPNGSGGMDCAMELAIYGGNEVVVQILVKKFPYYRSFGQNNCASTSTSLLELLCSVNMGNAIEDLIKCKSLETPTYDILITANDKTKLYNWLKCIFANYNPSTEIKTALSKLKENNKFKHADVRSNINMLVDYLNQNYGPGFIKSAIGGSYSISDPICFRFEKRGKMIWLAQELRNMKLNGLIIIWLDSNRNISISQGGQDVQVPFGPEIDDFIRIQLSVSSPITVDLSDVLGIGGESIVIRHKTNYGAKLKAMKIAPYDDIPFDDQSVVQKTQRTLHQHKYGQFDIENELHENGVSALYKSTEFVATRLTHQNLLRYDHVVIDIINGRFAFIVGKGLNFKL